MHEERARVGRAFEHEVLEEPGTVFGGGLGTEGQHDRGDVIVDRLRQTDHRQVVVVFVQIRSEVGSRGVGVVATDGVKHIDAIGREPLGGDRQRVLAFGHEASFHAVSDVGELHPAVTDRAAAEPVEEMGLFATG